MRLPREAGCMHFLKRRSMQDGVRLSLSPCLSAVLYSVAAHVLCVCVCVCFFWGAVVSTCAFYIES